MKTFKKYLFLLAVSFSLTSCLVDDDVATDEIVNSPNLVGFTSSSTNALVTQGTGNQDYSANLTIVGPTVLNISEDINVTVTVNTEETTAVEGVHFSFTPTTTTLSPDSGLTGTVPYTVLTDDPSIEAPSEVFLVLNVTEVSGGNGAIPSGRTGKIVVSIRYLCNSDLEGTYTNPLVPQCDDVTGPNNITVTQVSSGRYLVSSMTGYTFGPGNCIEFYMIDVCGQLTYDGGGLEDNGYSGEGGNGVVNSDGSFTITLFLNDAGYSATSTYTPL